MRFAADGFFWLNDDKKNRVRGRLSFTTAEGGDLRLDRALPGGGGKIPQELEVVHGQTLDGTPICLINLFTTTPVIQGLDGIAVSYFANQVLVGTDDRDQLLERVRVGLRRMHDFTERSLVGVEGELADPQQPLSVSWSPPQGELVAEVDGLRIQLLTEREVLRESHRVTLLERSEFELSCQEARPMEEWFQPVAFIDVFVAFLLGAAPSIERFYAPRDGRDVDYLFLQLEPPETSRKPWLTVPQIAERFGPALNGWFRFARSDEAAYHVLGEYLLRAGSSTEGGSLELQDRLLYLARFIEIYHRGPGRFERVAAVTPKQQQCIDEVIASAPTKHQQWLRRRLEVRPTLRERVIQLVESFDEAVKPVVGPRIEGFAQRLTDNRNYYTHYSDRYREKGRVAEALELSILVTRLYFLVRACVLREMGFDNDDVRRLLRQAPHYYSLAARSNAETEAPPRVDPDA